MSNLFYSDDGTVRLELGPDGFSMVQQRNDGEHTVSVQLDEFEDFIDVLVDVSFDSKIRGTDG